MKMMIFIIMLIAILFACNDPLEILRHSPVIHSINLSRTTIYPEQYIDIEAVVTDEDKNDELTFLWESTCEGHFVHIHNNPTQWYAPENPDTCIISITVSDGYFEVSKSATVTIISSNGKSQ